MKRTPEQLAFDTDLAHRATVVWDALEDTRLMTSEVEAELRALAHTAGRKVSRPIGVTESQRTIKVRLYNADGGVKFVRVRPKMVENYQSNRRTLVLNHDAVWPYMPMIACLYCDMLLWTARTHGWHDWTDTSKTWVRAHTDRCAMRYLINLAPKGVTP